MEINAELATKVLSVIDAGLVAGLGSPEPGKMCVEAAVCYAMGLPHSDEPTCVSSALRRLKIILNDASWSTDVARTKGLRRLGVAQLGSAGTVNDSEFVNKVSLLVIQKYLPIALNAAASLAQGTKKQELQEVALLCSLDPTVEHVGKAQFVAAFDFAAHASAASAAAAAAAAHASDFAASAAFATASAAYAASSAAAYATATATAAADAAASERDLVLAEFGEDVVQILIEMKAPGCKFLYLTETN